MPLQRTPLLSFKAQGSVGQSVTYSRVKQGTIAKRIPTHLDAQTDAQIAHRRRFINARYYWHALAQSQRDAYETTARPYHMTGWAYYLRHYLATDPNQVLWLPFDQGEGSIAYDLSSRDNHGTLYGPSWIAGKIHNCLSFDGIDNYVDCGNDSSLDVAPWITVATWIYPTNLINHMIVARGIGQPGFTYLWLQANGKLDYWLQGLTPASPNVAAYDPILLDQWSHIALTFNGSYTRLYVNAEEIYAVATTGVLGSGATKGILIGRWAEVGPLWFNGHIDEPRIYNRGLTAEQIKLIALKDLT